ncbi:DUF2785 domain-containing protein [Weissella sagaensis]|uniref:DUF2785 domain-containing protein n=1 Tax=Weissella sagaensis TaxID=2559928 RepID=UPI00214C0344|nr:DUF2785 domain-containing protein [Weissella sagaensis]
MIEELEALLKTPATKLDFTNNQVDFMLKNIGNTNPYIRDNLVYTLFTTGFMNNTFTLVQQEHIIDYFFNNDLLLKDILAPQNDYVFTRSFSALLGGILLECDDDTNIFNDTQRKDLFKWSIQYLNLENDYRGFVPDKGWAHAIAHGSDFLGSSLSHTKFQLSNVNDLFITLQKVINRLETPFLDNEEARLASAFKLGVQAENISVEDFINGIQYVDKELWQQYDAAKLNTCYRLYAWIHILQHWLIFFANDTKIKTIIKQKLDYYYNKMGYIF